MSKVAIAIIFLVSTVQRLVHADCLTLTCQNGGSCFNLLNVDPTTGADAVCVCPSSYTGATCEQVISAQWSTDVVYSACSVTCNGGYQTGTRNCVDSNTQQVLPDWQCAILGGGRNLVQQCNTQACPTWSTWSDWSQSSTLNSCGLGVSTRTRSCLNGGTPGVDGGCTGATSQDSFTQSISCSLTDAPVKLLTASDQSYSDGLLLVYDNTQQTWGSVCADGFTLQSASVACKSMGMTNASAIVTSQVYQPVSLGNVNCLGTEATIQSCYHTLSPSNCTESASISCVSDGYWSPWSAWSTCAGDCGSGVKTRSRTCVGPTNGGQPCQGSADETASCTVASCSSS